MAIIHHDVTFSNAPPRLVEIKKRLEARSGLEVHCILDRLDPETVHVWPHIGQVKESGVFECDEANDTDFELTVGSTGVRITWVVPGINHYISHQTLATLKELGGTWEGSLPGTVTKKWSELSEAEKRA